MMREKRQDFIERIAREAAGVVLVREAGGRITDFSGRPRIDPEQVLAGNPALHQWLTRNL